MYHTDIVLWKDFFQMDELILHVFQVEFFALLYQWVNEIYLMPSLYLADDTIIELLRLVVVDVHCANGFASWRQFVDDRDIQVTIECHRKGSGNGGGGHNKDMRDRGVRALFP